MKLNKNDIGGFIIITFVYLLAIIISVLTKTSVAEVMSKFQFNVLIILIVMELFTNLISSTGIMEKLALKISVLSKGERKKILVLFGLLMFIISAFLNNITAVLMILPIIFVLLKTIGLDRKYLNIFFALILALSNTGGASSPIGDFPAIVIMSSGITTFLGYLFRAFPFFFINSIVLILWWRFSVKSVESDEQKRQLSIDLLNSKYKNLVLKKRELVGLLIIFFMMFLGWSFIPQNIIPSEIIALLGYVIAMLYSAFMGMEILQDINFKSILTISSFLFLAGVVAQTGFLNDIATYLQTSIHNPNVLLIVIMLLTSIMSGLFGAGPAASAMMPIIIYLCETTFVGQSDWVAIAYAASICAGSSLFMWSATAGFILSKNINEANLVDRKKSKLTWNILDYLKYGVQNYIIQIVFSIIVIYLIIL